MESRGGGEELGEGEGGEGDEGGEKDVEKVDLEAVVNGDEEGLYAMEVKKECLIIMRVCFPIPSVGSKDKINLYLMQISDKFL